MVPIVHEADRPENGGSIGRLSFERLGEFDADLLLVATAFNRDVLSNPLYQSLGAVQAGRVIELGEPTSGSHYPNYVFVARFLLDALSKLDARRLVK